MAASDIFKGLLSVGAGYARGYVQKKREDQSAEYKRMLKDMDLAVKMENIRRLAAEDQSEAARRLAQTQNDEAKRELAELKQLFFQQQQWPQQAGLIQAQVGSLYNAMTNRDASTDIRLQQLADAQARFMRLFGDEGDTPYGPAGARIGPDGKVASGGSAGAAAEMPDWLKTEQGDVLRDDVTTPQIVRDFYAHVIPKDPSLREFVAARAYEIDPSLKTESRITLFRSPAFVKAIEEAMARISAMAPPKVVHSGGK